MSTDWDGSAHGHFIRNHSFLDHIMKKSYYIHISFVPRIAIRHGFQWNNIVDVYNDKPSSWWKVKQHQYNDNLGPMFTDYNYTQIR